MRSKFLFLRIYNKDIGVYGEWTLCGHEYFILHSTSIDFVNGSYKTFAITIDPMHRSGRSIGRKTLKLSTRRCYTLYKGATPFTMRRTDLAY